MPQEKDRPRPHGDPLSEAADDNRAQQQSDTAPDEGDSADTRTGASDDTGSRGSTANGIPAFDEDGGDQRRKLYKDGADLVSRLD